MKYVRIFADADGESHLDDGEFATELVDLVDGAPQATFTLPMPVSEVQMFRLPPGEWQDDWHPAPRLQLVFVLAGAMEIETSDGDVRQLSAGEVLLAEDIRGKGHITRSVDGWDLMVAWMPLAEDARSEGEEADYE